MDPISKPSLPIPDSYLAFAKACAALAESNGIKSFALKITPDLLDAFIPGVTVMGAVQINYTSVDQHGRPCVNLTVHFDTSTQFTISKAPDSGSLSVFTF